jgi:hypothetical protein
MNSPTFIASVLVDYVELHQSRQQCIIGISAPIKADKSYEVHVGLPDRLTPYKIYGEDSLQSLGLAFIFMRTRIKDMQSKGDLFYYSDTEDQIPFDIYFPLR